MIGYLCVQAATEADITSRNICTSFLQNAAAQDAVRTSIPGHLRMTVRIAMEADIKKQGSMEADIQKQGLKHGLLHLQQVGSMNW